MATSDASGGPWSNGTRAAISLTVDNMGEAADLNRNLWPTSEPIGRHYSVTRVLPTFLKLFKKYDIDATFFIESWNLTVYGDFILGQIVAAGHELAWHAWQHEAWAKIKTEEEEEELFGRSLGPQGIGQWTTTGKCEPYSGFRPPGGIINGDRTLSLCQQFGIKYISPAAEQAATVAVGEHGDNITILPFKWATVDAYFYMETFAGLRQMKGEYSIEPQSPEILVERYIAEVDKAIETGGFLSVLFHPFLTDRPERLNAMETVVKYIAQKRDAGQIWVARCKDIDQYIRSHPDIVGLDPKWDTASWR